MISSRMKYFELYRPSNTFDSLGVKIDSLTFISDIDVAVIKNVPSHDNLNPSYDLSPFCGITKNTSIEIGDVIKDDNLQRYLITDIGNKGTTYISLFLTKYE